jgi:hypothetical protein
MSALLAAYVAGSLIVGYVGRNRQIGFAGFFVLSLLLSPVVMFLVYLLGNPRAEPR